MAQETEAEKRLREYLADLPERTAIGERYGFVSPQYESSERTAQQALEQKRQADLGRRISEAQAPYQPGGEKYFEFEALKTPPVSTVKEAVKPFSKEAGFLSGRPIGAAAAPGYTTAQALAAARGGTLSAQQQLGQRQPYTIQQALAAARGGTESAKTELAAPTSVPSDVYDPRTQYPGGISPPLSTVPPVGGPEFSASYAGGLPGTPIPEAAAPPSPGEIARTFIEKFLKNPIEAIKYNLEMRKLYPELFETPPAAPREFDPGDILERREAFEREKAEREAAEAAASAPLTPLPPPAATDEEGYALFSPYDYVYDPNLGITIRVPRGK